MQVAQRVSTSSKSSTRQMAAARPPRAAFTAPAVFANKQASISAAAQRAAPVQSRSAIVTRVAAPEASASASGKTTKQWYALVASAEFYFNDPQNEAMAEQLRERVRWMKEQNREVDFFIVPEPKWLDAKYPELAKKVRRPSVALMSTDKEWIVFMKLRLDRVLRIDLGAMEDSEALAVGGTIPEYKLADKKWTAPYQPYSPGWWNVFVPKN